MVNFAHGIKKLGWKYSKIRDIYTAIIGKNRQIKIGVISDTHKKVAYTREVLDKLIYEKVDYIVHAGDIVKPKILEMLKNSNIPYTAVLGNNDSHMISLVKKFNLFQEPYYFKIGDIKAKIMHHPYYLTGDCDLIVYGHTHHFKAEYIKNSLFINPGEICAKKKSKIEFAIIEKKKNGWRVEYLHKNLMSKKKSKGFESSFFDF